MGLVYGVLGTAVILLLMALGIRKRSYASRLGTVQGWTSAHVYLGLLTLLIIPMHAGFKFRFDIHTLAFVLLVIVVLSGILGIFLYQIIPPRLTKYEAQVQADKVDKEINSLLADIRSLAKSKTDAFVQVYQDELHRLTAARHKGLSLLLAGPGTDMLETRARELAEAVATVPEHEQPDFQILAGLILQIAQLETTLAAQMRLQNALNAWLYIHVPVSFALVAALALHVALVSYY